MGKTLEPRIEDGRLVYFTFNIHLPDASRRRFGIFHDLAELFDLEYQEEAVSAFRDEVRRSSRVVLRRLDVDRESGCAFVTAAKPESILVAALAVNHLCAPQHHIPVGREEEAKLHSLLTSWKRPRTHKWGEGDVFAVPLCDGSYAHGQVLAVRHRSPTCALLDARAPAPEPDSARVLSRQVLSILHLGSDLLDQGTWKVVGQAVPVADPDSGPDGDGFSVGSVSYGGGQHFVDVAEAYYGLKPWNVGYCGDDDYFAGSLMPGIGRPASAWVLSPAERARYREEHGITA